MQVDNEIYNSKKDKKKHNIDLTWKKFIKEQSKDSRDEIMLHYIWLVKYVIQQMKLPSNSLLTDRDFLSIGILGLHESISRFEYDRGVKFESFAVPRIRGIIRDELRRIDWLSRTARKKANEMIEAEDKLRSKKGREVTTDEIIKQLGITPEKYSSYLSAASAARASLTLFDSSGYSANNNQELDIIEETPDPDQTLAIDSIENQERLGFINKYLKDLNKRKRLVMTLYYFEELTFKEIGKVLAVSESRICQIHTQLVNDLREKLIEFENA